MELVTQLYPYQSEAADKLSRVRVGALYMEMGTGKTRVALELVKRRIDAGKVKQALWLCPYSVQLDLPELLSEHAQGFEAIKICGIESLSASARINKELREYVSKSETYLIVDESLLIKNPYAYRTQNIIALSRMCKYKLILNGTPISRNEADLFAQWYVLDWRILGYKSYWSFQANHLEMDPDKPGRVVRVLNPEYLARKIAPYTYEASKDSVLSLPPKKVNQWVFKLPDGQRQHYGEVAELLLDQVDEMRPETIYRLFGALRSIVSGFEVTVFKRYSKRSPMFAPENNPRIRALLDIIDTMDGEQCVIYCQYTQEIDDIMSILGDKAIPFNGEMSRATRQRNKESFRRGEVKYFVANKACAQFGLNLQFCRNEIFYSNDWDWGTRVQAEDRVHRAGQTREVRIWDIIADETIDETILRCVLKKEQLSDLLKSSVRRYNGVKDMLAAAAAGGLEA